jgi:hypothetical protein
MTRMLRLASCSDVRFLATSLHSRTSATCCFQELERAIQIDAASQRSGALWSASCKHVGQRMITKAAAVVVAKAVLRELRDDAELRFRLCFISGSAVAGSSDPNADVDVHVLHDEDWWQMKGLRVRHHQVDLVLAPLALYEFQLKRRHRIAAQILLSSYPIDDPEGLLPELVLQARAASSGSLPISPPGLELLARRRPLSLLRDAEDLLAEGDELGARFVIANVCDLAIGSFVRRRWGPLDVKHRYRYLRDNEPSFYQSYEAVAKAQPCLIRLERAREFIDMLYEDVGGLVDTFSSSRVPWRVAAKFFG